MGLPRRCSDVLLSLASCASAEHALELWPTQDYVTSKTGSIEDMAACALQVRQHPKLLRQVLALDKLVAATVKALSSASANAVHSS